MVIYSKDGSYMSKTFKLLLFIFLLGFVVTEISGICKWVDENGVVHYAETCPEDVNATGVPIHKPPSKEQAEATARRAGKIREDTQYHRDLRKQEEEQQAQQKQAREGTRETMVDKCAEARWNLAILNKQLPVYFDEQGLLHSKWSLHDYWYTGNRNFMDDPQRQAEISHYTRVESETCTDSEEDIRARTKKYWERNRNDMCGHLKTKLKGMQEANTGIPSDKMRELQAQIESRCGE